VALDLVKQVDVVVHCAALSAPWGPYQAFQEANVQITQQLLAAAKQVGIKRFIQISSPSIYVQYQHQFNIKEDYLPKKFVNAYAATKYLADQAVLTEVKQGLEAIILRPRAIYGAQDQTIMPRLLKAYQEGRLKIIGKGDNYADLTTVQNLCDAILLALETQNPLALGQIYNISNGAPVPLWSLIPQILEKLNLPWKAKHIPFGLANCAVAAMELWSKLKGGKREPTLTRYGIAALYYSTTLNIDKAKTLLQYHPKQSNEEGIDEFVQWWKTKTI